MAPSMCWSLVARSLAAGRPPHLIPVILWMADKGSRRCASLESANGNSAWALSTGVRQGCCGGMENGYFGYSHLIKRIFWRKKISSGFCTDGLSEHMVL
jgi:hypothetical protein